MSKDNDLQAAIIHDYRRLPANIFRLRRLIQRINVGERIENPKPVDVILCSDYKIRKLNARFRGRNRPTDVLSFAYHDNDLLGEIYISLQRVGVQARRYGLDYQEELERLLAHGYFHLLGYTHHGDSMRREMEAREAPYCCTSRGD